MIHLLVFLIYSIGKALVRLVPIGAVFRAGEMAGWCAHWLLFRRRRLAFRNLTRAFHSEKSPAEIRQLAREHFRLLGANLFSCVKLATMSREEIHERVTLDIRLEVPPIEQRRGWIAMISHLGNWELFGHLADFFPEYRFGAIYHPLANGFINREMTSLRERAGLRLFDRRGGYLRCVKFLREGGALGVLVDQFAGVAGVWAPLFGRLTSTSQLAAALAMRAHADILPIGVFTTGRARWTVSTLDPFSAEGMDSAGLTARMNETLETLIRRAPEDWLWTHDRWKTPRPRFLLARDWRRFAESDRTLEPFRILIRAPDSPGEAAASLPAIRAIKQSRPDAWIAIAAPETLAEVFADADQFIALRPHENPFSSARKIRRAATFDAGVIFPKSWRAALAVWLAGVPCRAGHPARPILNYWEMEPGELEPPPSGADRYLRIAEVLGAVIER